MIPRKPIIEKDGDRLIVQSRERQVYLDRRLSFVWPDAGFPGYFVMVGRLDESSIIDDYPYVILDEGERPDKNNLYEAVIASMRRWHAKWMFAEIKGGWTLLNINFAAWLKKMNVTGVRLIDTHEFSGIRETIPMIRSMIKHGSIIMTEGPLKRQLSQITSEDLRTSDGKPVESRFPAVSAFGNIVNSYELYPFKKRKRKNTQSKKEGYS